MVRVLITEAHDGLGLALVKEYLTEPDNQVVAFCGDETKCDQLNTLNESTPDGQLLIVPVNLADEESIKASVEPIEGFVDALDLLIFNTGFIPEEFANLEGDVPTDVVLSFVGNLRSPKWLAKSLLSLLAKGTRSMCIGMSLYYRSENALLNLPLLQFSKRFPIFAERTDPSVITVFDLNALRARQRETDDEFEDILERMDMRELIGQDEIKQKAKALFENIPKLPHGKHCYWNRMRLNE